MTWAFSTDPEFQERLDWIDKFVREEVEPLDLVFPDREYDRPTPAVSAVIRPLQEQVRSQRLWATHLGPELGGGGFGQLKLALINEILGRSAWAPVIFGCQAPDSGNAEILAKFGTQEQKERYLRPLLDGEIFSSYSMTEPQGGADPKEFRTLARRDGDEWVIEGEKFFSSHARVASFLIVMAVTNPDVPIYEGMSMFLVPTETPGIEILRHIGTMNDPVNDGTHAWIRYNRVRVPEAALLGTEGGAFVVAQTRLAGGRIHHAMRTVARCRQAFDMACERVLSRHTQGGLLADKQMVQEAIAQGWTRITQFRLLVLYTAWLIDQHPPQGVRKEIAACKVEAAKLLPDIVGMAMHLHGALGVSNEMPLAQMWMDSPAMGIVDGPTEVHQVTIARQVLRDYTAAPGVFPSAWLPPRVEAARRRYADVLDAYADNL